MAAKKKFIFLSDIKEIIKNSAGEVLLGISEDNANKKEVNFSSNAVRQFKQKLLAEINLYSHE